MMDKVFIEGLRIEAIVGIYAHERKVPQELVIDLQMAVDIQPAARSQNIEDAVDYAAVAHRLETFIVEGQFLLVETLAEETAAMVMREFSITWLSLRVAKTQALESVERVGVQIERGSIPG